MAGGILFATSRAKIPIIMATRSICTDRIGGAAGVAEAFAGVGSSVQDNATCISLILRFGRGVFWMAARVGDVHIK